MLEKPDLPDEEILSRLRAEFGLPFIQLTFLPLGADVNTAAYRAVIAGETSYFLKLRTGNFDEASLAVPIFLKSQGVDPVLAPLQTLTGQHCAELGHIRLILYPFIEGQDAYQVQLSDQQWLVFGAALRALHTIHLPPALTRQIQTETYSPRFRQQVTQFQAQIMHTQYHESVAAQLAAFMQSHRLEISRVVARAEHLAASLRANPLPCVLCHSDLHPGNLLLTPAGELYIVDWDAPILAPKERDLMFIGGGVGSLWNTPREIACFYQGYTQIQPDPLALTYYRYERIVQDIAAYCEQLLLSSAGGEDRQQSLRYLISNFLPGQTIEIADQTAAALAPFPFSPI